MCKPSLNVVPNVLNRLKTLAWPWSDRSLPKGNQWECWDPGLGCNLVGLPVHQPPQYTLTPLAGPHDTLHPCQWECWDPDWAQCGQVSSPPATPNAH